MSSRWVPVSVTTLAAGLALCCGASTDGNSSAVVSVGGSGGVVGSSGATGSGGTRGNAGNGGAAVTSTGGNGVAGLPSGGGSSASGGMSALSGATGAGGSGGAAGMGAGGLHAADAGAGTRAFKGVANSPCAARTLLGVSWYYNWEQKETEPCTGGGGGEFVPMVWGHTGAEQSPSGIKTAVSSFVTKKYGYVLGFNEPDNTGQSNLSVATAISLLPSFDDPAILVGTPATAANAGGQTWFKDFMGQLGASTTLRADFITIHWYGWNAGSCDAKASQLESYIKYAEGFAGNRPIWLTEWGCLNQSAPTASGVVDFYNGALAVFARHPRVARYAWYPWSTNCGLNNTDGTLTALGVAYAAAPASR